MAVRKASGSVTKEDIGKYALPESKVLYKQCGRALKITNVEKTRVYLSREHSRKKDSTNGVPDPSDIEHLHLAVKSIVFIADTYDEAMAIEELCEKQFKESLRLLKELEQKTNSDILALLSA